MTLKIKVIRVYFRKMDPFGQTVKPAQEPSRGRGRRRRRRRGAPACRLHDGGGWREGFSIDPRLAATLTAELVENHVFVDANASVRQQLLDTRDRESASDENTNNQEVVASWSPGGAAAIVIRADPKGVDWSKIMQSLRAGGAFDDPTRPEGLAFAKVRSMGREAYPHLLGYIDNEDTGLGRAAVAILNELTGRYPRGQLPNENTKLAIKAEWEHWLENN